MCAPLVATCRKNFPVYFLARSFAYTIIGFFIGGLGHLFFHQFIQASSKTLSLIFASLCLVQVIFILAEHQVSFLKIPGKWIQQLASKSPFSHSVTMGLVTGLLPCGFLYSALTLCVATGSMWLSALGMLLFSVVTIPALFFGRLLLQWTVFRYSYLSKIFSITLLLLTCYFLIVRGGWKL